MREAATNTAKGIFRVAPVLASCFLAALAHAEPVQLSGGWVADFSPMMMEPAGRSTGVFQFDGSYKLVSRSRGEFYFAVACVGIETDTKDAGGAVSAKGHGRCEFKDKSGDKLLAGIETVYDGITFHFDGGTGKWATVTGTAVSKETFTLETERQLKGYSNVQGDLAWH